MSVARLPIAFALLLLLAACGAPSDRAMVASVLDQPGHMAVTPRAEAPIVAQPTPQPRAPAPAAVAPPPRATPAPPRTRTRLSELAGLHADLVADRLGKPTLVQSEAPGQVWLYRHATCALHVFLYEETGGYKVRHAETRATNGKPPLDAEACYQAVAGDVPIRTLARD
jgi:hypothetical protein